MFKTNIFGYKKKDVNEFVKQSINSVIKLRKDIFFLENECAKKDDDNKKLLEEIAIYKEKQKNFHLINSHLIKLKGNVRACEKENKPKD